MSKADEIEDAVMRAVGLAPQLEDNDSDVEDVDADLQAVLQLQDERTIDWLTLSEQEFPPLAWAIDGLIPEGYGLIVAPPKAGKSWFVLDIAVACATGSRALDALPAKNRPVLYLALEDGHRRLQDRLNVLKDARHVQPNDSLKLVVDADALEADVLISRFIEEHHDEAPLIILDTIGRVMPGKTGGENEYQRDYRFGAKLKKYVAAMPGGTLLAVHHTNKGIHSDFQNAVSGTQGIAGAADFTAVIQRQRNEDEAVLSITGRDVPEAEYGMKFDAGLWSIVGGDLSTASEAVVEIRAAQAQSNLGDRMTEIVHFVDQSDTPVTPAAIAEKFGLTRKDAGSYLARAERKDLIAKQGRGKYVSKLSNVSKSQVEAPKQLSTAVSKVSKTQINDEFLDALTSALSPTHGLAKAQIVSLVPKKLNPEGNLDAALSHLEQQGLIVQDLKGDYRLTQGGE